MDKFKILDGGTAEELVRIGKTQIYGNPLWSSGLLMSDPDAILTTHKNFLRAGAELVVTTSYQAWIQGLVQHQGITEDEAFNLIKKSVQIGKQACLEVAEEQGCLPGLVAGSVGPYGASLCDGSEYTGNYLDNISVEELQNWHLPRLKALREAGTDLVAIETIPGQKEAEAVVRLIESQLPDLKAYVTFSCKDGESTCCGEPITDAINSVINSNNVIAVGFNCTAPQYISPLLESIQALQLQKPIIVKPNSGEMWTAKEGWYGKVDCLSVVDMVPEWIELGATWIGGCCRVYPDDIERIAKIVHQMRTVKATT